MCNRYLSPNADTIARLWQVNARTPIPWWDETEVFPRAPGPFIRGDAGGQRALAIGTWGLIPIRALARLIRTSAR